MRKNYLFFVLFFALISIQTKAQTVVGDWKFQPVAGAMEVGNASGPEVWWSNSAQDVDTRSCLFDDIFRFNADGTFENVQQDQTWLEGWQGTAPDACGTPVAPHDGSVAATYTSDATSITLNGAGAHLGLAKAINGGELATPGDAPSQITYTIESLDSDYMTLYIGVGANYWRFRFINANTQITNYNVTFEVDTRNIFVGDRGMFLGGGIFGGSNATAMADDDGDGIWTVTVELQEGTTGNYAFFNSPGDGGDWNTKENLAGLACADADNFNDRYLDAITGDTTISYCFATCEASCTPVARYDVTFEVGTANETVTTGVFLGGGAFGNANNVQLYDADGDGIYSRTLSLPEGMSGGYKFAIDPENHWSYSTSENFAGDCTEGQYNDRPLAPVTEATTYSYCFGSCEAASTCALDTTAPVITLVGDNPQEINNGDAYTELGATATDDVDGDISANIVIDSSAVDTSVDGSYTVTYDVSDAAGNEAAQVTRTVNVSTPAHCDSTPSSNDGQGISSVSFNGTDFTSGGDITYEDFTATAVTAGQSTEASLSITFATGYTYDTHVWIDLNDDFTFDSTELLYSGMSTNNIPTTLDASFVVPADAPLGDHRVRIGTADTGQATPNPCYSGSYGVTIDMTITVTEPPACLTPVALTVSAVAATNVDVAWTSDGTDFNIEYGPSNFTQGTGTTVSSATTSANLSGLDAATDYDFYVQNNCGLTGGVSDWAGPVSFTTLCNTVTSFPYTHGFETLDCWTNSDASAAWALDAGDDYGPGSVTEGSSAVFFNDYDYLSGSTSDLMSPNLDLSALTIARLTFDYYDGGGTDIVEVLVDNGSGPVVVYTTATSVTPWTTITVDLPDYAGQTVQIGFRGTSVYGTTNPHIDNLTVAEAPSCLDPTAITASDVTTISAEIAWTAGGTETAWNIEWGTTGFILGEGTSDATTSPAYSLSGLTPNQTGYDFYVQADCGGDTSGWAGPFTFYTACDVFSGAWSNDFETDTLCWLVVNQGDPNGWGLYTNSTDGGGAISFGIEYGATAHDDYLISPAFSVIDGTSDRFTFDARNQSASFPELFNVQVWSVDLGTMLGTLASQINATGVEFETFSYDLSDYEGQDVRVAIHATDTNQWVLYIDNVVVDATLGIDDESMTLFNYFPNPVNDVLTIKAQNNVEDVKVFNMLGQMVLRQNPNSIDCTVDLSAMQTGAYFVQVSIGNRVETVRVLKK